MGMDPITLSAMVMGAGQLGNAVGGMVTNSGNNRRAARFQNQMMGRADAMNWQGDASDPLMRFLNSQTAPGQITPGQYTASTVDAGSILGAPTMNLGNDALMQMLRSDPSRQMDPSARMLIDAFAPQDARMLNQNVAGMRATAPGLGQRFGTAMGMGESNLRATAMNNIGTRNAGIAQSAYENAQNRRLQAAGSINQQGLNIAQLASQLGLANQAALNQGGMFNVSNNLQAQGMNADQANLFRQFQLQGYNTAFGQQMGQRQFNQSLLGMMMGQAPQNQANPMWGQGAMDIGQLMMMLPMLRSMGGGGGGGGGNGQMISGQGYQRPVG
jgi:hypothetical protein